VSKHSLMVGYIGQDQDSHSAMSVTGTTAFSLASQPSFQVPDPFNRGETLYTGLQNGKEVHGSSGRATCSLNSVSGHLLLSHKNLD